MATFTEFLKIVCAWLLLFSLWYPFIGFVNSDFYEINYWKYPVAKYAIAALLFLFSALMTWAASKIWRDNSRKSERNS